MNIERAIEILDPNHRENYESIDPINEACLMGMQALKNKCRQSRKLLCTAQQDTTQNVPVRYAAQWLIRIITAETAVKPSIGIKRRLQARSTNTLQAPTPA